MSGIILDWGRTLFDNENGQLFQGVPELLAQLRQTHKLVVVSICAPASAGARYKVMYEAGILDHFALILFGEDKPEMYDLAVASMQWKPNELTIVDDRVRRGVAWGNAYGCMTVWVRSGKFANELPDVSTGMPTATIASVIDLGGLFGAERHVP